LYKCNYDYGIKTTSCCDYNIVSDYYKISFMGESEDCFIWFKDTLNFLTLFDCFTFMLSGCFEYLFDSEQITFIKITAGKKVMFEYDNI